MKKKSIKKFLKEWKVGPLDFWEITFIQASCIAFGMFLVLFWGYSMQLSWPYYFVLFMIYLSIALIRINKKMKK